MLPFLIQPRKVSLPIAITLLIMLYSITIIVPIYGDSNSIFKPYSKTVLDNGLKVIIKEVHSSPIVAVDIQVATGAKNESAANAGISHFLEHMLFKGTQRRKVGEMAREITSVGGNLNGSTSFNTTHYYVTVPSQYIDRALDVEADAIMNSSFDPEEIERERLVVLEEIRISKDNNQNLMNQLAYQKIFPGTPYANSVLGTADSLKNINRDTFLAYFHKYYVPNNMAIAVVGDINSDKVLTKIKQLFKDFKPDKIQPAPSFEISKLKEITRYEIQRDVHQTYMFFGFPVPKLNPQDGATLGVLGVLLGSCENSRLYKLYAKKLIHNIRADYYDLRDAGLIYIYVETENNASVLESKIQSIIKNILNRGITDEELAIAKTILQARYTFGAENNYLLANIISYSEVTGSASDAVDFEQSISKVTKEDVMRMAKEYLNPKGYVLVTLKAQEGK